MSLGERLIEILSRWRGEDIRPREESLPVWDIGRPGLLARRRRQRREAVAACREELLAALLAAGGPIFAVHQEPSDEYGVPGVLPPDFDPHDPGVRHWLFVLGGWC